MSDSSQPHESQHARPPCPSPTLRAHSDSRPSSQWCHPAISSSVVPFSSCPQYLPASESFPMSQLFAWGGQSTGVSALASLKYWKGKFYTQDYCTQQGLLYPARIIVPGNFFKIDGEIKSFSDKQKLREFSTTKPALRQMLKGVVQSRNTKEKRSTKSTPNN